MNDSRRLCTIFFIFTFALSLSFMIFASQFFISKAAVQPSIPTNVTFKNTRDGIKIMWESDEKSVQVFKRNHELLNWTEWTLIGASQNSEFIDTSVEYGRLYQYQLRTVSGAASGEKSQIITVYYDYKGQGINTEEKFPENWIPEYYEGYHVGYIWDVAYGDRSDWNPSSPQYKINQYWRESGYETKDNIMAIDDKYLIAVKPTFGKIGDWVTFWFEDGMRIDCIIYDEKGNEDNATMWGHIERSTQTDIKVLEFYMPDASYPISFMSSNNRVCQWENHGQSEALPNYCVIWN